MTLATHLHLVPKCRQQWSYTSKRGPRRTVDCSAVQSHATCDVMSGFTKTANELPVFATSCTRHLTGICHFLYQAIERHLPLLVPGTWTAFATSCTRRLTGMCHFLYQALDRHLLLPVPGTWSTFATSCTRHLTDICYFLYQALDRHLLHLVPGSYRHLKVNVNTAQYACSDKSSGTYYSEMRCTSWEVLSRL